MKAQVRLWWRLWCAQWRAGPVRMLVPVIALALGVSLATAVQLVNRSALAEFEQAARRLSGDADLVVRGPVAGFQEGLYPLIARVPGSPIAANRCRSLRLIRCARRSCNRDSSANWRGNGALFSRRTAFS